MTKSVQNLIQGEIERRDLGIQILKDDLNKLKDRDIFSENIDTSESIIKALPELLQVFKRSAKKQFGKDMYQSTFKKYDYENKGGNDPELFEQFRSFIEKVRKSPDGPFRTLVREKRNNIKINEMKSWNEFRKSLEEFCKETNFPFTPFEIDVVLDLLHNY